MLIVGVTPVCGFLADEVQLFERALAKKRPLPSDYCYHSDGIWDLLLLSQEIIRDAGIPRLRFTNVWIGRGTHGLCWILPDYYRKNYSKPKVQEAIMRLKKLANIPEESSPKWWALSDGSMPVQYAKKKWWRQEYKTMSIGYTLLREPCNGCVDKLAVATYESDDEETASQ